MLLTAMELSAEVKLSRDQIYRLARAGTIPAYKIGHEWRFRLEEVLRHGQSKAQVVQPTLPGVPKHKGP